MGFLQRQFGGVSWDRTRRAITTADLQSTASPLMLLLHVLIVTLSIDYVNTISGSVGKCVLKHIDDISALIAWCGTNML